VAAATAAGSRRDLLPDIEEINSSLRSAEEREGDIETEDLLVKPRRSGFGLGFMLVVLIAALAVAAYALSEQIVASVPSAEPAISAYVAWADNVRSWIDSIAQDWVRRITGMVDSIKDRSDT
jgi:hypothetical protein